MASSRYDKAAIIVAILGDNGKVTGVRRFLASEHYSAERDIVALVEAGRRLRVSFIDRWDNGVDALSDDKRAELMELVPE